MTEIEAEVAKGLERRISELEASAAAMRKALENLDPRRAGERFEEIASDFRIATGHMAPGKDRSVYDNGDGTPDEEVRRQWREFVNRWHEAYVDHALASDAGKTLLARLEKAEAAVAEADGLFGRAWRDALEAAAVAAMTADQTISGRHGIRAAAAIRALATEGP